MLRWTQERAMRVCCSPEKLQFLLPLTQEEVYLLQDPKYLKHLVRLNPVHKELDFEFLMSVAADLQSGKQIEILHQSEPSSQKSQMPHIPIDSVEIPLR